MCTVVIEESVRIPGKVIDLESFRRWARSDDAPDRGCFSFFGEEVWVDMSAEDLYRHNLVKGEFSYTLLGLLKEDSLGKFFQDRARLSHVGAQKDREYLLESLVFPNATIAAGFETMIVTLKNGAAYAGIIKSENESTLEINSPEEGLLKLKKTDIQSRDKGLSAMPEELGQALSKQDLRDVMEFLSQLK